MAWPHDDPSAFNGDRRLQRTFGYLPNNSSLHPPPGLVTPVQTPSTDWSTSFPTELRQGFSTVGEAAASVGAYPQAGVGGDANVLDPWEVHIQNKGLSGAMPSSVSSSVLHQPVRSPPNNEAGFPPHPRTPHSPGRQCDYVEADEPRRTLQYTPVIYNPNIASSPHPDPNVNVNVNVNTNATVTIFSCKWDNCGYNGTFSREASLIRHLRHIHWNPGAHPCEVPGCHKVCNRADTLLQHLRNFHHIVV